MSVNLSIKQLTQVQKRHYYHFVWLGLFMGWVLSAADRGMTGPIVTWMINHHISFFNGISNPHALGGLIGGLFFAGYMLTQFPGGYIGDKFGYRNTIILSLIWAGIATFIGGFVFSLISFVALRVITGLGEGMFYSNDRSIVAQVTPIEKRSLGMGVVLVGLPIGVTLAYIATATVTKLFTPVLGIDISWRIPFLLFGLGTSIVGVVLWRIFRRDNMEIINLGKVLKGTLRFTVPFFAIILFIYYLSSKYHVNDNGIAAIEIVVALSLVGFAFKNLRHKLGTSLRNKNLILLYLSAFPFLWNLWFFNFWSGAIIQNASHSSFLVASLIFAIFNAGAGILGFPIGGWLADFAVRRKWGRKRVYLIAIPLQAFSTLIFGVYLMNGGHSLITMGVLLFFSSFLLNIPQPISQAMTADIAEKEFRGSAFGMWNLIGEMASVLSPVVSGSLMDAFGSWYPAIFFGSLLMFSTFFSVMFIEENN